MKSELHQYKNFELTPEELEIYEEWNKIYGRPIEDFKQDYFTSFIDIGDNILEAGDEVYYVYGTLLRKGIIENITPFSVNASPIRIKIKGIKKLIFAKQIVKIKL